MPHPANPPFRSDLFYAIQNEDYASELAVVDRLPPGRPLRVLMVASSGENALSVLADERVAAVHAVDTNPAQVHLAELRRAAVATLDRDDQLRLLGSDGSAPGSGGTVLRQAGYDCARAALPPASRDWWDERREREIAFGIHFVGRNDVLMHEVQASLAAAGFAPFDAALTDADLPAWQAAYGAVMTRHYFRDTFGLPTDTAAAKLADLAPRVAECHFRALQAPGAGANYFLTTALANRYALDHGDGGLPAYLQAGGQAVLRRPGRPARLHLHVGSLFDQATAIAADSGAFDLISISNIGEWLDDAGFATAVAGLRDHLAPGGALLVRTASASSRIIDLMAAILSVDLAFNAELARVERGPWFRTIGAGFRGDEAHRATYS